MSKRFGRNQRRRAREALAVEVQRVEQTARLAAERLHMFQNCSRELDNLREFFAIVARRVGRESVLVGGEAEAILDGPDIRSFRMSITPDYEARILNVSAPVMGYIQHEIMRRLEVQAVRDVFKLQTVVRCYLGHADAGIALSDTFLKRSTEKEITHRIAQELAQHLAHAIKAAK